MIQLKKIGNHENVLDAEFGTGDIRIVKGKYDGNEFQNVLMFYNQEAKPIGTEDNDSKDKSTDELGAPMFTMTFNRPESITALIHSLAELQKEVFKHVK